MWQVYYGDTLIGDPRLDLPIYDKDLQVELNSTGKFEFTLGDSHPMNGKLVKYQKRDEVRVVQEGELVFCGRVVEDEQSFDRSTRYTCEGDRGYLNDAILEPYETGKASVPSTPDGFFNWLVDKYNDSMDPGARFTVGINQGSRVGADVERSASTETKVWPEMKAALVDELGCYVRTRYDGDMRYIDLLVEGDSVASQRIEFGENLMDFTHRTGGEEYCTRVFARGGNYGDAAADKLALTSLVGEAQQIPQGDKSDSAKDSLDAAILKARVVLYDTTATQSEADSALSELQDAIRQFYASSDSSSQSDSRLGDKTQLTATDTHVRGIDRTGLSERSVAAIIAALSVSTEVLQNQYATQAQVNAALSALESAANTVRADGDDTVTLERMADRGLLNGYALRSGWVVNEEAEAEFGVIEGTFSDPDATDDEKLLASALRYLVNTKVGDAIEMTAFDLHNVDPSVKPIRVGDYVRATSRPHGFDEYFICTSRKYDLDHPENDEFSLGSEYETLTGAQSKKLAELNADINSAVDQVDAATALAGSKAAIFSSQPSIYMKNDLWVQAPAGDDEHATFNIMVATSDSDGTFDASDWERASDYTNDQAVLHLGAVYAEYVEANDANITNLQAETAKIEDLTATQLNATVAYIEDLTAENVTATDLTATNAYITDLEADNITAQDLSAAHAYIADLEADNVTAQNLIADHAEVGSLDANYAQIDLANIANGTITTAMIGDAQINSAKIANGSIENADIKNGTIETAKIKDAAITTAKIGDAQITTAKIGNAAVGTANIKNAAITNALIANNAVSDEKVLNLSANKLTAGTIDAQQIDVTNLHASSLIVDKLNGQPVLGGYTYVPKGSTGYASKNPSQEGWYEMTANGFALSTDTTVDATKAYYIDGEATLLYDQNYIDGLEEGLNQRIDGAVETFTGDHVPTLNNYPAADWLTDTAKSSHVGDIYFVTNSALDQDGYNYRFAYDNTTQSYLWVLIKDSDVTKALGDISDLQSFESTTTSWINTTDQGLTTIRQNHTALSGVVDKTVKSSTQLWFTKANTTAPSKPTSQVTSTSTAGNAWRVVVPAWNVSYPNYYYCWQYLLADNTYAWSDVVRDIAMGESQGTARDAKTEADANIKSSVQLWYTKANSTAPSKPTAQVTTNNAATGNAWNLAVPTYNASYQHYFYCYQQQKGDGNYQWSDVVYDKGTTEAMQKAQAALPSSTFTTFQSTTFKNLVDEVDEQSSTITQMTETMQYGGANLILASDTMTDVDDVCNWNINSTSSSIEDGVCTLVGDDNWREVGVACGLRLADYKNKYLTISFDMRAVSTGATFLSTVEVRPTSSALSVSRSGAYRAQAISSAPTTTWARYSQTFHMVEGMFTSGSGQPDWTTSFFAVAIFNHGSIDYQIRHIKVEVGEIATPWGCAPQDVTTVSNVVNSVKQTADANTASISGLSTVVSNNGLTETTNITSRASKIEQTLDGFSSTVGAIVDETVVGTNILTGNALNPYNWTVSAPSGASYTKTAYGTAGVKVQFSAISGWEWLYSPAITVESGKKYTLSVEYTVGKDYIIASGRGGYGLSVYKTTPPHSSYDNANTNFIARAQFFETETRVAMKATVTFTASSNTVYLGLNGVQINDSQTGLEFTLDKLTLVENISSRVSTAETSINQTANAIGLTATGTATIANPNLTPFFESHNSDGTYPNGGVGGYWQTSSDKAYNRSVFTALGEGWAHIEAAGTAQKEFVPPRVDSLKAGDKVTMLVEWRNATYTGTGCNFYTRNYWNNVQLSTNWYPGNGMTTASGEDRKVFTVNSTATGAEAWNGLVNFTFPAKTSSTWTGDVRVSFYLGDYKGPWKPYSGSQLYASQAELKVANDAISARVEKNGVIAAINASVETSGGSAVTINADKVNIAGATLFTTGRLSSTSLNNAYDAKGSAAAVQQNLDNLEIGGVNLLKRTDWLSDINQVQNLSMSNCTAQYVKNDATPSGYLIRFTLTNAANNAHVYLANMKSRGGMVHGETYIASLWIRANKNTDMTPYSYIECASNYWRDRNVVVTTQWEHCYTRFVYDETKQYQAFYLVYPQKWTGLSNGDYVEIYGIKLERGTKPTDWTLAPEDQTAYVDNMQVGGTNLLAGTIEMKAGTTGTYATGMFRASGGSTLSNVTTSGLPVPFVSGAIRATNGGSSAATVGFCQDSVAGLKVGDTLTQSGWIRASSNQQVYFQPAWSGTGNSTDSNANTPFSVTTEWQKFSFTSILSGTQTAAYSLGYVYSKNCPAGAWFEVCALKVEKGQKATDWSANPRDQVARTQRIYYRKNASGAPSVPTSWVTTGNNGTNYYDQWTTKVPPIKSETNRYLYLYTCEQSQKGDGTLTCTTVLLDDTTTVIDGGNIITGSVTANKLNATNINASGVLTIGSLSSDAQAQIGGNGFTILWDSNAATIYGGGEAKLCLRDPLTGTITANSAGWVMWNGVKRTVPNAEFNPNANLPYNIPIYLVLRLSSATSTTGTMYAVFYQSGWKVASAFSNPTTTYSAWTWVEATDIVLGKCVEPGSEAVFTECETYEQPRSYLAVTNTNVTAGSANANANNAAKTATNYITADSTGIKIAKASDTSNYQYQTSSGTDIYVGGKKRTSTNANGLEVFDTDGSTSLAKFSTSARIGKASKWRAEVSSNGLDLYGDDNVKSLSLKHFRDTNAGSHGGTLSFAPDTVSDPIGFGIYGGATSSGASVLNVGYNSNSLPSILMQRYVGSDEGNTFISLNVGSKYLKVTSSGISGLAASDIPNLAASQITSGTLGADRIPSLAASKITSGTFGADRIPSLAASKIGSGTLPVARGGTNKTSGEFFGATRIYSSTATCTTFTLTASAANYSWLTILYKGNDGFFDSVTVFNNKAAINVALSVIESTANGTVNIKRVTYQISGTSATVKTYGEADLSGSSVTCGSTAHVTVTGVWGWV